MEISKAKMQKVFKYFDENRLLTKTFSQKNIVTSVFSLTLMLFGCSKTDPPQDKPDPVINKPPGSFTVTVSKVSYNYAMIEWSASNDPENDNIMYSIYLNDKKIADSITNILSYKIENLTPENQYTGYVNATDSKSNSIKEPFALSTTKYYIRFSEIYGFDDLFTRGVSIAESEDKGFVIAGFCNGWDLALIRIDSLGREIWKKSYQYIHRSHVEIKKTIDNGYIIVGFRYVLKISGDGNKVWDFVTDFPENDTEYNSIIPTDDNGYMVVGTGYENGFENGNENSQVTLTKLDSDGKPEWVKYYGKPLRSLGFSIEKTSDNNYILLGSSETTNMHIFIIKVDENGQSIWSKIITGSMFSFPNQIKLTQDKGFIISSFSMSSMNETWPRIVKIDEEGNTVWDNYYLHDYISSLSNAICQTSDGGYAFTGSVELAVSSSKSACLLVKLKPDGTLDWEKQYKRDNEVEDFWYVGYDIVQTKDNGFIISAEKSWIYNPPDNNWGFWVFKTDPSGEYVD